MKILICLILPFIVFSTVAISQTDRASLERQRQIEEIMKVREEMIKSLLNDSAFQNFDNRFEDLVKKFQQESFGGMPGMDEGTVFGEYDWRETETQQILVLKVKQIKDRPLDIKIEKGQIKLKGDVESVEVDHQKRRKQVTKVHFERSFSIPEGVDQNNPEFETKDGELLIKFKKLNSSKAPLKSKSKIPENKLEPVGIEKGDTII